MATSRLLTFEIRDVIEFEKAVVRRLQAALTPSLIPPPRKPSDRIVIDTVAAILADERVQGLLRTRQDRFAAVIRAADEVVSRRRMLGDEDTVAELWEFIDEDDLNAMLATANASEQPEELLLRMFEGPYRTLHP
jgi:hypothetical protein